MIPDPDTCYRAVAGRDPRFDGWFVIGVTSTGIYCRPSCPARTPTRSNATFHPGAAAAQAAGFRACKRCRPDASPGSPEWDVRADLAARAVRLIGDGVVDREGVGGLARRLGYSERQVHRCLVAELGAGPLALARAQRAQTARILLETTDLPATRIAFAAGFASVRQFNDTVRVVFASTPTQLRRRLPARARAAAPGTLRLRLAYRSPIDLDGVLGFLCQRTMPGVEEALPDGSYRRALDLPHGAGVATLGQGDGHVRCELVLDDLRDLAAAVARCRRLLDLDADPAAVDETLGGDPALTPLVAATPGRRSPGAVDGPELAVRAVLGQQVSVAAACTIAGRLAAAHGEPLDRPVGAVTVRFPRPAALAAIDPATLPMPASRARALHGLAVALADGDVVLDAGVERDEATARLLALPGIGPWTASYVALRALSDPDAFLPTDLGVRHGLAAVGLPTDPRAAVVRAERWRPWRGYALHHLWAAARAQPTPQRRPA